VSGDAGGTARGRTRLLAVVAALGVIFAGWGFVRSEDARLAASQPAPRTATPLDAVPRDALLLVTADLAALRRSGVASDLLAAGREVPGLGDVRAACGFDPVVAFDELALAIPTTGGEGDFGVVAAGRAVQAEQILACSAKIIEARGGKPVVSTIGRFATVRDVSLPTAGGEIAARPGDRLVLLGSGAFLRAMVDAADAVVPDVRTHELHSRLRAGLGDAAMVRGSVVLGKKQRAAIADEVQQAGAEGAPPFVAKVAAAAVGATLDGERIALHVVLACDDPRAALEVAASVEKLRGEQAANPLLRLGGFGPVIDDLALEVERDLVHARVTLTREQAETLATRLLGSRAPSPPPPSESAEAPPAPSASASAAPSSSAAPSASTPPKRKKSPPPLLDERR
jgi:hypothetical protein